MSKDKPKKSTVLFYLILLFIFILGFDKIKAILNTGIQVLLPFIIGALAAVILNIPVRFFENKVFKFKWDRKFNIKRHLSIIVSILCLTAILVLISTLVIPRLYSTVQNITNILPTFIEQTTDTLQQHLNISDNVLKEIEKIKVASGSWNGIVTYSTEHFPVSSLIISAIKGMFDSITTIGFTLAFILYSLIEKEKIKDVFHRLVNTFLHKEASEKVNKIIKLFHENFEKFFYGQCVESFIIATLFTLSSTIFGFKSSIITGVIMLFLALIPYVGNILSCIIGAILTLAMETPTRAFWFVVLFIAVQTIDAYLIYPRVIGGKVGMPPYLIFCSAMLGNAMLGVIGMVITIPIVNTIYVLIKEKTDKTNLSETLTIDVTDIENQHKQI